MPKASDLLKVAPKYLGVPYSKMDCQGFVEACLSDIGIDVNLPGSNAWYRKMTWAGTPEECKSSFGDIPRGAFLFILKQDGKEPEKYRSDGIGNASHIGIYTGMKFTELCEIGNVDPYIHDFDFGDGAINSSSSHGCVCTSKFAGKSIRNGWNRVGLWDALSYEMEFPAGDTYGGEIVTAIVTAPSGSTVKMRAKPSTSCRTYWEVPVGETVTVLSQGEWDSVSWHGKKGYIMSEYVKIGTIQPGEDETDKSTITVERNRLQAVYDEIGAILGVKG